MYGLKYFLIKSFRIRGLFPIRKELYGGQTNMVFEEKRVVLRNGKECILRSPRPSDALDMISYLRQTSAETPFMVRYPEEVTMSVEDEEKFLYSNLEAPGSIMIAAVIDGRVIGNLGISCISSRQKLKHRASLGIAIEKEFWGLGIGTMLMSEGILWARKTGYEQIELEVADGNEKAFRMYRKFGFAVYGTRERGFKFKDGTYASEHLMMKKLTEE